MSSQQITTAQLRTLRQIAASTATLSGAPDGNAFYDGFTRRVKVEAAAVRAYLPFPRRLTDRLISFGFVAVQPTGRPDRLTTVVVTKDGAAALAGAPEAPLPAHLARTLRLVDGGEVIRVADASDAMITAWRRDDGEFLHYEVGVLAGMGLIDLPDRSPGARPVVTDEGRIRLR